MKKKKQNRFELEYALLCSSPKVGTLGTEWVYNTLLVGGGS